MRQCSRCLEFKEDSFYWKLTPKSLRSECKDCTYLYRKLRRIGLDGKKGTRIKRPFISKERQRFTRDKDGYVIRVVMGHPNAKNKMGHILEHRYIMSEHLGRPLMRNETIHHKNGIRDDNRIENLELWDRSHPPGKREKDLIEWCVEYISARGYKVIKE